MARGQEAKDFIMAEILKTFSNAFINGKEVRIPYLENGEEVQVKVTLTAAKDNVPHEGAMTSAASAEAKPVSAGDPTPLGATKEEEERLAGAMKFLGLF